MNYQDPEIFNTVRSIKEDVDNMTKDELTITLDKCEEMLGLYGIPERYYYDANAYIYFIMYIYFIRERLKSEFKVGATQ